MDAVKAGSNKEDEDSLYSMGWRIVKYMPSMTVIVLELYIGLPEGEKFWRYVYSFRHNTRT